MRSVSSSPCPVEEEEGEEGDGRGGEETLNDVNNMLLKGGTETEISGMHDVTSHGGATVLR